MGVGGTLGAQQEEATLKLRGQEDLGVLPCPLKFAEHVLGLKVVYMERVLRNSVVEVCTGSRLCSSSNLAFSPSEKGGVMN